MFGMNNLTISAVDGFMADGIRKYARDHELEVDAESVVSVLLTRFTRRRARRMVIEQYAGRCGISFRQAVTRLNDDAEARADLVAMEIDWDEFFGFLLQMLTILIKLM